MRRLGIYALKRLLFIPPAIFIIITLSFWFVNIVPSDPAAVKAGDMATAQQIAQMRQQLGLDHSLFYRYIVYVKNVAQLDLGRSYYTNDSILSDIGLYLPQTIELVVLAMTVAALVGVTIGTVAAFFRNKAPDYGARIYMTVTQSIPDFFLGLLLIFFVFYKLGWAPAPTGPLGLLDIPPQPVTHAVIVDALIDGDWAVFRSAVSHAILPVLTLGLAYSAYFAKTTRAVLGNALTSDQVEFARACGLPERQVIGYAFGAARAPIITFGGLLFAGLAGGAAIVETVFAWGGIGQYAVNEILQFDLPGIQGVVLVFGLMTLVIYLLVDLAVVALDPRVSYD